jgi:hypothetical protein
LAGSNFVPAAQLACYFGDDQACGTLSPALSAPQPFYFYIAGLAPTLDFAAPIGLDISAYLAGGGDAGEAGDGMGDGKGDGSSRHGGTGGKLPRNLHAAREALSALPRRNGHP